jgi:phosphoserine phosphatase
MMPDLSINRSPRSSRHSSSLPFRMAPTVVLAFVSLSCQSPPAADTETGTPPAAATGAAPADPLPSWRDGQAKTAILEFVAVVTDEAGPDFVPETDRIATFDNDGTLWPEQPLVQGLFAMSQFERMLPDHPEWRSDATLRALADRDTAAIHAFDTEDVLRVLGATHTGMTQEEFQEAAASFFASATYPPFGVPITDLAYQPQLELIRLLEQNGFRVWIVSGGTIELIRAISDRMYGIPRERVIGTRAAYELEDVGGRAVLRRLPRLATLDDRAEKAVNIASIIGRRPILACGNERSGGDVEMLRYSQGSPYRSLQLIVDHDDATREFSYDEPDSRSLDAAAANGWTVVSMQRDWNRIFSFR